MDNTTTNVQGREIKFRAIVPVNSEGPKSMEYFDLSKIDDLNRLTYADYDIRELMQFIGLKDKSGKEIYESDILTAPGYKPMVVSYNNRFASFCIKNEEWMFQHWFGEAIEGNEVEVIGNIYEHPHLLKAEGIIAEGLIDHGNH